MLEAYALTLNDPAVRAAKQKWEDPQRMLRRKTNVSFETIFGLFKEYRNSFKSVGKRLGITGERARQIYNEYFCKMLEGESGYDRLRMSTLEQRAEAATREAARLLARKKWREIIDRAHAAHCEVAEMARFREGALLGIRASKLYINGHPCAIYVVAKTSKPSGATKRAYYKTSLARRTLAGTDAVVFYAAAPGQEHVFIVPTAVLLEKLFRSPRQQTLKDIYLPTEKLPVYNNVLPRIDFWSYENAWELLSPKH